MKCPIDTTVDLVMTDRQGIEIDYCPTCRGVWLDRGELDKLIERAASSLPRPAPAPAPIAPTPVSDERRWRDDDDDTPDHGYRRDRDHDDRGYPTKKKKRRSFFDEIFDF